MAGAIVLVHGAWHNASCWDGVVDELRKRGREVTAVQLPLDGFRSDAAAARSAIVAAGAGSVVVGHSYGGSVISEAAADVGTVARLIYVAAFMTDSNDEVGDLMVGSALTAAVVTEDGMSRVDPDQAPSVFYGDSDPEMALRLTAQLRPMKLDPATPEHEPAWRTVASSYLICTEDRALPPAAQRKMAEHAADVWEWDTDHSPFTSRPKELAGLIAQY